tara:strand:+ start:785 stop:1039 length:255 start_codon:yes stop_codon:yes gene_type:complete
MLVLVNWVDILGEDDAWSSSEEVKELRPAEISTVGRLLIQTDDYIVVVSSWDHSGDHFGNVNCIPRGVIRELKELSGDDFDQKI